MDNKIRIGVSSCLLGHPVRYNGGHKQDRYITNILSAYFEFVPVCPEVECGLPVPRETMHLAGDPENPRLVTTSTGIDYTEKMKCFCEQRIAALKKEDLGAFIFKKDSPSSGLQRVKVYDNSGKVQKKGRGLFAEAFVKHFPLLPVEEEGRLNDIRLRENFIERVFCYYRWKTFLKTNPNYKKLVDFHSRHKLQIMAHSPKHLSKMGKLAASGKNFARGELLDQYQKNLMEAMALKATVKKNVNVLYHIMGHFKTLISADEKKELLEAIDQYSRPIVPLVVPLTLVKHYARKYNVTYLHNQVYLEPHPAELMLRNHV
ncbi:MAG: DUF523 and DUF1722 domain-containing protein [Bacillota bacterium]